MTRRLQTMLGSAVLILRVVQAIARVPDPPMGSMTKQARAREPAAGGRWSEDWERAPSLPEPLWKKGGAWEESAVIKDLRAKPSAVRPRPLSHAQSNGTSP